MRTTRLSAFFQTEPEGLPAELRQVVANSDLFPVAVDIATTQSAVKHGRRSP
jgi:hypothetical protein